MRKFAIAAVALACLGVTGCANLTAQQQSNLQLQLQVGEKYAQIATNLYCLYEPVTSKIIGVFDASKGTTTALAKLDTATAIICQEVQSAAVSGAKVSTQ